MIKFGALSDLVERGLKLDTAEALFFVFSQDETKDYILFLNRTKQIFNQGVGIDGGSLGEYSPFTDDLNLFKTFTWNGQQKQKIAGEPYFLYDSGALFDSFTVTVNKKEIEINAFTVKEGEDLESKFGDFVGLTEESQSELINFIQPLIVQYLKNVRSLNIIILLIIALSWCSMR
jgi:hypothetical protein